MKKRSNTQRRTKLPEYASRIKALRGGLGQKEFAKKLGVGQPVISAWEGGKKSYRPSREMYIRLGNFAARERRFADALWLWEQGGVEPDPMFVAVDETLRLKVPTSLVDPREVVQVRPTKKVRQEAGSEPLLLPASWRQNRAIEPTYVRITDRFLAPLFEQGDMLIIDESETDASKLKGACVAIYSPETFIEVPVEVAGTVETATKIMPSGGHKGVYAAWLLKEEKGDDLTVSFPSRLGAIFRDHLAVTPNLFTLGAVILGRVIAWVPGRRDSGAKQDGNN